MKNTIIALYCRISRDDDKNDVSSSIKTQKDLLKQYAKRMHYVNTKFYIDEGYSGTNFDRPGFQELIREVEEDKIGVILTKDLSRLGRNYLSTGYYIEHYFPSKNVRYIAINDNVDTSLQNNDFTPFKNIINEWYARDISRKIKSAYKTKAESLRVLLHLMDTVKIRMIIIISLLIKKHQKMLNLYINHILKEIQFTGL